MTAQCGLSPFEGETFNSSIVSTSSIGNGRGMDQK